MSAALVKFITYNTNQHLYYVEKILAAFNRVVNDSHYARGNVVIMIDQPVHLNAAVIYELQERSNASKLNTIANLKDYPVLRGKIAIAYFAIKNPNDIRDHCASDTDYSAGLLADNTTETVKFVWFRVV